MTLLLTGLLPVSGTDGASMKGSDLDNAEKLQIIKEIILKFQDKARDTIDIKAVREEISRYMEIKNIVTDDIKKRNEFLELQVKKKFPETDEQLRIKYQEEAEKLYPFYKIGDEVKVFYQLHGKIFQVEGIYYRRTPTQVWIGPRKISLANLSPKSFSKLDENTNISLRSEYVKAQLAEYYEKRKKYSLSLVDARYHRQSGEVFFYGKWVEPDAIIRSRVKYINDANQIRKIYKQVAKAKSLARKIAILQQALKTVAFLYPIHIERITEIRNALVNYKIRYIAKKIQEAVKQKDLNSAVIILESAIEKYPDAKNINDAKKALELAKIGIANKNQEILDRIRVSDDDHRLKIRDNLTNKINKKH